MIQGVFGLVGDVLWIVVYVVFGIGFFGGGVIMCDGFNVCGLNIVVIFWCIVVIGVLCSMGLLLEVMFGSLVVFCVNILLCDIV